MQIIHTSPYFYFSPKANYTFLWIAILWQLSHQPIRIKNCHFLLLFLIILNFACYRFLKQSPFCHSTAALQKRIPCCNLNRKLYWNWFLPAWGFSATYNPSHKYRSKLKNSTEFWPLTKNILFIQNKQKNRVKCPSFS